MNEQVAESILYDSTAGRLHSLVQIFKRDSIVLMGEATEESMPMPVSIADFSSSPKSTVRAVTEWSAKSAAAFHRSIESLMNVTEVDVEAVRYMTVDMNKRLLPTLNEQHTFDKGNDRQLRILEECRRKIVLDVISNGSGYGFFCSPAYKHEDSQESPYIQAADFAAGIASHLYSCAFGIVEIASRFEYVTYNGARISMTDAEEIIREAQSLRRN